MFVALDIATNCGWAAWQEGWAAPIYGAWKLPGEAGEVGRAAMALHQHLADLHAMDPIERLYFEGGIPTNHLAGRTGMTTIYKLAGLAAHAESFAYAVNARCRNIPQGSWKKYFIGKGSGFTTKTSKAMSLARCREIGWAPQCGDSADALGVLDYAIYLSEIVPPWRDATVLRREIA